MLNTQAVFTRLDLGESAVVVVQRIRESIEMAADQSTRASQLIKDIIGIDTKYRDENIARTVAMKVGEMVIGVNHQVDNEEDLLASCEQYASDRVYNPSNAWIYARPEPTADDVNVVQVVADIDVKVAVKANGKIKKGGKQILADELWKKYVLEAKPAATNQEIIAIIMKDLDMSKAGATTYAYNCKNKLGEPEGGIVKAKKGRKAKVSTT